MAVRLGGRELRVRTKADKREEWLVGRILNTNLVVCYRWPLRLVMVALMMFVLYISPSSINEWKAQSFVSQAKFVALVLLMIGCLCEVMIRRTIFFSDQIELRTMFGQRFRRSYDEISAIEIRQQEWLKIRFSDGTKLRIWGLETSLETLKVFLISKVEASRDGKFMEPME